MKIILIVCGVLLIILSGIYLIDQQGNGSLNGESNFISCLQENGVIVYGSPTCPYCVQLVSEYDGYDDFHKIYVNCNEDSERCSNEMLTDGVPETQIKGELLQEWASPDVLAEKTGCQI